MDELKNDRKIRFAFAVGREIAVMVVGAVIVVALVNEMPHLRKWIAHVIAAAVGGGPMTSVELELAKLLVTTIATGVAAYYAIKIAASQRDIAKRQAETALAAKKVAEAKLNFDLFEERYALFEQVWGFLSRPVDYENPQPMRSDFTNLIPKAQFLFGAPIADYMREASSKQIELSSMIRQQRNKPLNPEQVERMYETELWFAEEAMGCFKKFAPYLDFSAWKVDPLERFFNLNAA